METDEVRLLASKMREMAELFQSRADSIYSQIQNADWWGGSRDEFVGEIAQVCSTMRIYAENCDILWSRLETEIIQWEETANVFMGGVVGLNILYTTYLGNSSISRDLITDARDAGITFIIKGPPDQRLGAENGEIVNILWAKPSTPGALGEQSYDPETGQSTIVIDPELKGGDSGELGGIIAHEMQHALDYNSGIVDIPDFQELERYVKDGDFSQAENWLESYYTEKIKTEVNAHARGYAVDPNINYDRGQNVENKVNLDGVVTADEAKFIFGERTYGSLYNKDAEQLINEQYKDQHLKVVVDMDSSGQVNVTIKERPLIIQNILEMTSG